MEDEADQRERDVDEAVERARGTGDPLTIALVVFFVALIVIVAALLALPMLGGS
jgi:hypothetical protein